MSLGVLSRHWWSYSRHFEKLLGTEKEILGQNMVDFIETACEDRTWLLTIFS
jgi:hypothetical protein